MNEKIASIIKAEIENLPFMGQVSGLVRPVRMQDVSSDNASVKVFPISCDVSERECISGKYTDLVPDSKYKSIHYFEDMGVTIAGQDQDTFSFEAKLRLVGWLNLKKLGKTDCSVSHLAIAAILKAIRSKVFNSSPFTKISIRCTGIEPKSAAIFSKYTYSEEINQYLLFPFDYYALNFTVAFTVPYACIDQWVTSLPNNCENGS